MPWLRIDDGFADHGKVEDLSPGALALWVRAACWCRKATNARTNGFVPRSKLTTILKNRVGQEEAEALARELVEATGGGVFSVGLWEAAEGGWRFHDWGYYQPEREAMSRSEAARKAGRTSAERRRQAFGTAQPPVRKTVRPNEPSGPSEEPAENTPPTERRSSDSPNDVRPNAARTLRTPDPDPDPDPERDPPLPPEGAGGPVLCPRDLALTEDQRAMAELNLGIPGWAIDALTTHQVGKWCDGETRRPSVAMWRRQLFAAIRSDWSEPTKRPKKPEAPDAATLRARAARDRMEAEERARLGGPDVAPVRGQAEAARAVLAGVVAAVGGGA